MDIPLDEVIYVEAIASSSTGAAADADSTPTFAVYEEATDTDIGVGGNMTKRTSLTGNYRASFTASAANGFEVGKWYSVIGSATIGAIATKGVLKTFRIVAAESLAGYPKIDVHGLKGDAQSATDLQDFADAGYDPGTNKVQGVVLVDTITTYTGNTLQTGDSYGIVSSGTHGNAAIKGYVDDIGAAGAGLTAVPWNAAWDTEVQSEVQDAIEVNHLDHLLAADYDPAAKPGVATALLNEMIGSDAGVSQWTANALELSPAGGGGATDWSADERTAIRSILGIPASGTTPADPTTGILDTIRDKIDLTERMVDGNTLERSVGDTRAITFEWLDAGATVTGTVSLNNGAYGAVAGAIAFLRSEGGKHFFTLAHNAADRPSAEGVARYKLIDGVYEKYFNLRIGNLPSDPADQSAVESAITSAVSGLATAANQVVIIDGIGYVTAALIGACADAGTAAETYAITFGGSTYTLDHTDLTAAGNRGAVTRTKT